MATVLSLLDKARNKVGNKLPASLAALVLVVAVVLLACANASGINRQLHAWKLLPEPERLTELYYQDHTKLPGSYVPGESQSFSFTVHNLEYRTVKYAYSVTQSDQNGTNSQTLLSGSFIVAESGYHTQPVSVTPADLGSRSQIATTLTYPADSDRSPDNSSPTRSNVSSESIHYWVTKK